MKTKLLVSFGILCCVAGAKATFGNSQSGGDKQKNGLKDVFSSLFGLKKTFLGASKSS